MARPRGNDWLEGEIAHFKKQNVSVVVSLLEQAEIDVLGLGLEETLCEENNMRYINFPIVDRGVPDCRNRAGQLINQIRKFLSLGRSVVIHCRMGIGRSSIIAAATLLNTGLGCNQLITRISKIRGLKVPDTEEQLQWLKKQ